VSVDVEQATGVGVALVNAGFADGSTALVVHAAGTYPVYLGADVADTLPDGTYTGNGVDAIALQAAFAAAHGNTRPITRDVTFHNRGVPYCGGMKEPGEIVIGDISGANVPLVTLEPGVAIGFPKGTSAAGRIRVLGDSSGGPTVALGALSAVGTAESPIVFSSCEGNAAPGDWIGLTFAGVDPRTQLDFVGIGNAGANSGVVGVCETVNNTGDGDAAVQILFQQGAPSGEFITNSLITGSAGSGIFRGWGGGADIDFLATNQMSGIAWCSQTLVPDMLNACPSTPCMTAP
jgi:hypothetical protein